MIRHERSRVIDATPEAVWAVLGRFMQVDEFAPMVASVDALTNGEVGVGSQRRCHFENGGSMVEEVTGWQEGRGFQVRIADAGPMPLKQGHADIRLTSVGSGKTRVVWGMDYQVKYGPIGWLMGQTMMKAMMTKVLDGNLKGLEQKARAA